MRNAWFISGILMVMLFSNCVKKEQAWKMYSPDSTVCIELYQCKNGKISYCAMLNKDTMINSSSLGIVRKDADFSEKLNFLSADSVKHLDNSYKMVSGKRSQCSFHADAQTFHFSNKDGKKIDLAFFVSNDGIAFKYIFPDQDTTVYTITKEITGFAIPEGKAWMHPYDKPTQWSPAYETTYENGIAIGTKSPLAEGWAFPMLFEVKNKWMLISESNTPENYFAAHLHLDSTNNTYYISMPEAAEGAGIGSIEPSSSLPWETSWRVIILSNSPAGIFESTLITDVADPQTEGDFSWVKPGRASWSWWSDSTSDKKCNVQKEFVDFAKEMGWEYILVDANWDIMEGGTIEDVIKYANEKGVGVWLWYNSGGPHTPVTERPRDLMYDAAVRAAEMKKLNGLGVKGIKVDFFGSDKQFLIKLYHDIMRDAAANHIMVNFHGCTLPRGWSRTWPNLLGMEAVKGEECYMFDTMYQYTAQYLNTIYPFTRNVTGPMDLTPVGFSDQKYLHQTTYAHELALSVVFESGILHFADGISAYRNLPADPKQFLKDVPNAWDNSKLVDGYPGKFIVVARKKAMDWYVGALNSGNEKRETVVPLDFLGGGKYKAMIIQDGKDNKSFLSEHRTVTTDDSIKITIPPKGGFAIQILR